MNILSAQAISRSHGLKQLFSDLSFGIEDRERIGLIGVNGCGKSTLLRLFAGLDEPDSGVVTLRQDVRVQYLSQNPAFEEGQSVIDFIFESSEKLAALVRDYEVACARISHSPDDAAALKQFDQLSREMDACSAWEYEHQARAILGKLGVEDLEARVDLLSGGYRKRVALAHALLAHSDLLILDEPTNHLDADTVAWLEDYLRRFNGAVLLVTHDRYFLDRVTDRIAELDSGQLRLFEGNFSYYLGRKAEAEAAAVAQDERRRSILRKDLAWLRRGARARRTKEKARIERIEDLQNEPTHQKRSSVAFPLEGRRLGNKVVELENISVCFGSGELIRDFTYTFRPGERLGIIGPNGTGKTTLANIITGRLTPTRGTVTHGQTVVFSYFDQENVDLDPAERAIDYVKREGGDLLRGTDGSTLSAALVMERFLFTPQMLYTPIEKLSGGERRRLHLVRSLMRNPNFLILDEPTNDLDISTLQALEDFLDGYPGCLIVISHDRYFLDRTVDALLSFEQGGELRLHVGDYSAYQEAVAEKDRAVVATKAQPVSESTRSAGSEKPAKLSYKEQRELAQLEQDIPAMEERLKSIDTEMAQDASDYQRLHALAQEQKLLTERLDAALERWAGLAERA